MHTIELRSSVQRFLDTLSPEEFRTAIEGIRQLEGSTRPRGVLCRIRAGDHRILYNIDEARNTATILHIGRRGDITGTPSSGHTTA